jgi:polysaccharide export outer membrane protein
VRTIPDWQSTETVELAGEFRFPGTYNLLPGETLGELIDRAGGVTYEAFPDGAVYTARTAAEAEQEEMRRFVTEIRRTYASSSLTQQQQMASYGELEQAIAGLTERDNLGRIAIDLPRILAGDRGADLPLSDGDRIFLPRRNESITVLGEVFRPGSFRFEEGQSLRDYLALGAGATVRADEGNIYIVRADGRVDRPGRSLLRFGLGQTALRPGDTIIVPLDASYRDPLNFWTEITQVAFQTGIAVAAVLRN